MLQLSVWGPLYIKTLRIQRKIPEKFLSPTIFPKNASNYLKFVFKDQTPIFFFFPLFFSLFFFLKFLKFFFYLKQNSNNFFWHKVWKTKETRTRTRTRTKTWQERKKDTNKNATRRKQENKYQNKDKTWTWTNYK